MLNVAVIEDNDELRDIMVDTLRDGGYRAIGMDSAEAMVDQTSDEPIDILVVDVNLPGEDGFSLTRRLRAVQPQTGIIMVTGRNRDTDRKTGFEGGADIFLTKPVSTDELNAAVASLQRRLGVGTAPASRLRLDMRRRALIGTKASVEVRPQEAALLGAFARAPDMRLESWQILEIFERSGWSYSRANVGVAVFRLSDKLRDAGADSRPIRSIRNWGYRLCEPVVLF
jgi:DNA-binding response OmpR family regulator